MLQPYCPTAHAATPTFASASNTDAPPHPAAWDTSAHVEGMNWKTPDAPDAGLSALGLNPDSQFGYAERLGDHARSPWG